MNMHNVMHNVMRHVEHALCSSNKRGLLPLLYLSSEIHFYLRKYYPSCHEDITIWRRRCSEGSKSTIVKGNISQLCGKNGTFFRGELDRQEKMKPVFLAACGAKTYETLKNLCLPQEVSDVDYGDIIDKLKTHFNPEPLIIYERYMFGKRSRKTDERIADFAVDLKRLSASCKFGNFLDEALCMQFVVGLSMSKIQGRLMQESTLAFETAVKIAIAEHAAITSCAAIEQLTSRDSADRVHHVAATKQAKPARVNKSCCWRCGNSNHTPDSCRFKTQTCHGCNRVDHIQKRCDAVTKWTSGDKTAPFLVAVNISGERVLFQLDAAASVSLVGERIYKTQMSHFTLEPAGLSLTSYSGDSIYGLGKNNVPERRPAFDRGGWR